MYFPVIGKENFPPEKPMSKRRQLFNPKSGTPTPKPKRRQLFNPKSETPMSSTNTDEQNDGRPKRRKLFKQDLDGPIPSTSANEHHRLDHTIQEEFAQNTNYLFNTTPQRGKASLELLQTHPFKCHVCGLFKCGALKILYHTTYCKK